MQTGISQWDIIPSETYSVQAGMNHSLGRHTLKYGFEFRLMHQATFGRGNASGTFGFTRAITSLTPDTTDPNSGNAIASFLLGYLNSASATLNATPYLSWKYPVAYVQEDWQLTRHLTVNLGLRWDFESPPVERYNRQNRGFDFVSPSPIPARGIGVSGGLVFPGVNGLPRGAFRGDWHDFQPRFGIAYKPLPSKPMVVRGGFGRSYLPTVDFGGGVGFSQTTNAETSSVEGRSIRLLSNPFPSGLTQPPGAAGGLATQAGDSITFSDQTRIVPWVWQYSAGFQYELTPGTLAEVTYGGSQSRALQVGKNINVLTAAQLALGTSYLNAGVPNPFYGVLPSTTPRGSVSAVQRRVLLLPYPQFVNINMNAMSHGSSWFNSLQLKLERRFRHGFSTLVTYTNSKTMQRTEYLNAQDAALSRELASYDIPQRLVISGIWDLPLGRRSVLFTSGLPARLAGGWQVSLIGTSQSGPPIALPDYYIYGNPRLPSGSTRRPRCGFCARPTRFAPPKCAALTCAATQRRNSTRISHVLSNSASGSASSSKRLHSISRTRRSLECPTLILPRLSSARCRSRRSTCRGRWNWVCATHSDAAQTARAWSRPGRGLPAPGHSMARRFELRLCAHTDAALTIVLKKAPAFRLICCIIGSYPQTELSGGLFQAKRLVTRDSSSSSIRTGRSTKVSWEKHTPQAG